MNKYLLAVLSTFLSACGGSRYMQLNVNIQQTDVTPTKAVYSALTPVEGPDGVCVYINGKCDNSELDGLKNDLYQAYNSYYLATYHANLIYEKMHKNDGWGWMVTDNNIKEHENEFRTKSNNIVISPRYTYNYGSHYTATVYFKNQEIGQIKMYQPEYSLSSDQEDFLKTNVPNIALCAAKIGFSGTIGGERYKEGEKSPSMVEFFKQCNIEY